MFRPHRIADARSHLEESPASCIVYYSLVQSAYSCLTGSFEFPMALRLAGGPQYVALVYSSYYTLLIAGFFFGSLIGRNGRASLVFRLELGLLLCLNLGSALFFPLMNGVGALCVYFVVRGTAEGFYWSIRHPSFLWAVKDAGRDDFALRLQALSVAVSVVFPVIGGAVISFLPQSKLAAGSALPGGYFWIFLFTAIILAIGLIASPDFKIGTRPIEMKRIHSLMVLPEAKSYRQYLWFSSVGGVMVALSAGVITFAVLKTEFRIGALNAALALLSGIFFLALRRLLKGKKRARLGGSLCGAIADCLSRLLYGLSPGPVGLAIKTVLDSFAVPLKSLFGENVIRAHVERLSSLSGVSVSELYIFQEFRLWIGRFSASLVIGLFFALFHAESLPHGGPVVHIILALAAPLSICEFLYLRRFAREDRR